jgi:hypothetical protein
MVRYASMEIIFINELVANMSFPNSFVGNLKLLRPPTEKFGGDKLVHLLRKRIWNNSFHYYSDIIFYFIARILFVFLVTLIPTSLFSDEVYTLSFIGWEQKSISEIEKVFSKKEYIRIVDNPILKKKLQTIFIENKKESTDEEVRSLYSDSGPDFLIYQKKDFKLQLYEVAYGTMLKEWNYADTKSITELENFLEVKLCIRALRELQVNTQYPEIQFSEISNQSERKRLKKGDHIRIFFRLFSQKELKTLYVTILGVSGNSEIIQVFPTLFPIQSQEIETGKDIIFPESDTKGIKLPVSPPYGEDPFFVIASEEPKSLPLENTDFIKSEKHKFIKLISGKKFKVIRAFVNQLKSGKANYNCVETVVVSVDK